MDAIFWILVGLAGLLLLGALLVGGVALLVGVTRKRGVSLPSLPTLSSVPSGLPATRQQQLTELVELCDECNLDPLSDLFDALAKSDWPRFDAVHRRVVGAMRNARTRAELFRPAMAELAAEKASDE